MAYMIGVEITGGRSYVKKAGKDAGKMGWIHDCIIRDSGAVFMDVHFSDHEVKPGEYIAEIQIGQDKEHKRTYYINNLRPIEAKPQSKAG